MFRQSILIIQIVKIAVKLFKSNQLAHFIFSQCMYMETYIIIFEKTVYTILVIDKEANYLFLMTKGKIYNFKD